MPIAVIADIVGSRSITDRRAAQRDIEDALRRVRDTLPDVVVTTPLQAVVGDELQGVFPTLSGALATTLLQRLALPEGVDLRYGIGLGPIEEIPSESGALSEGPAWWAARAAIEHVEALARREVREARTWVAAADGDGSDAALARIANAGLLTRDRIIGRWSDRVRRLVYGRITGRTQLELAEAEQITQSAVSQTLSAAGATTVIAAFAQLVAAED